MSISLREYLQIPEVAERARYNLEVKSKVRHKIIKTFEDFDKESKEFLLSLKKEVFNGNDIYVIGSRIDGTYLDDSEYEKYSKEYKSVKKSDWDIRSLFSPNQKEFRGCKIDFSKGTIGIKI